MTENDVRSLCKKESDHETTARCLKRLKRSLYPWNEIVSMCNISYTCCGKGGFVKHHWHDEIEILYFSGGAFRLEINMESFMISLNAFILSIPANCTVFPLRPLSATGKMQ